ncbi:DEAD/DEAH box helicase [Candidatus Micrarchaeota archaeon]|nr:DEAD/DEAH box helicase [Candidatus Micrarchaeota archaeon]
MSFEKLGLSPNILKAVKELGFEKPTDIQEKSIPLLLQGIDVIGQAQTGSGKTAAFGITILEHLDPAFHRPQALVLVPTRELALQVKLEIGELGKYTNHSILAVYGGEDIGRQIRQLERGVQILVCTPGRLLDHLERRTVDISKVKMLVLDEADRMLDMGFIDDVRRILKHISPNRQTVFFSATMPQEIIGLAKNNMKEHEIINTSSDKLTVEKIAQHYVMADPRHKLTVLLHVLNQKKPQLAIIFVRTKRGADNLHFSLERNGLKATALHGNLTQARRERAMNSFRNLHANILVATDIASRGIDVDDVSLIVNYNLPEDAMVYAHRIGRTARAGREGEALTLASNLEEKRLIEGYARKLNCKISEMKIEGLHLPTLPDIEYRGHGKRPDERGGGRDREDYHRGRTRPGNRDHHRGGGHSNYRGNNRRY